MLKNLRPRIVEVLRVDPDQFAVVAILEQSALPLSMHRRSLKRWPQELPNQRSRTSRNCGIRHPDLMRLGPAVYIAGHWDVQVSGTPEIEPVDGAVAVPYAADPLGAIRSAGKDDTEGVLERVGLRNEHGIGIATLASAR